jgi:hypothetical protein
MRRAVIAGLVILASLSVGRYFFGKRLSADDLTGEQQYRRCRRRLR